MRVGLVANKKLISPDCYRLLSLVPEVQNDVEVLKPVLEELEVMRLSCRLGMLSSVNPKDFEMEMLEASEFDDDFALFLRKEIFQADENGESDGIKVVSLFGMQGSVKHELKKRHCWSDEMENHLFRKARLRDTATYVLRFLTCLSPNMVCCLSAEDVDLLEQTRE
eukprot:jgi/Phyca11/19754/fgenesh1_pg.PHYCAscaffold_52_\